ncbi:MAG TPA: hypothetical protein VJN21_14740 [Candidatus Acidoferrales bacterium]|nr:hypothetical protein [Candidatus Acidoferrales bacterium]
MLTAFDYILTFAGLVAPAYVVIRLAIHRELFNYFALAFYCASTVAETVGLLAVLRIYGFSSLVYLYGYYYSESVLAVLLYFVVLGFLRQLFEDLGAGIYARIGCILLLSGTALISFLMIQGNRDYLTSRFVVELGRNLNFVGVVLTFMLWTAMMKLHETRARVTQLVLALGVYFCGFVLSYGLRLSHPEWQVLKLLPPLLSVWLFVSWAYTLTKLPEEARFATLRVAAFRSR